MGYNKSTLYYLKKGAKCQKPFRMYGKVEEKLMSQLIDNVQEFGVFDKIFYAL